MFHSFQYLPAALAMFIGTVVFTALSVLIALWLSSVRSQAWKDAFRAMHPPLCASLMVAFAIFAVIVANTGWHGQEDALRAARSEAHALKRLLYHLDPESKGRVVLKNYMESVIQDEWPRMEEGRRGHPKTTAALIAVQDWVLEPTVPYASRAHEKFFTDAMEDLSKARDQRLTLTREVIPEIIWMAVLISALIVIVAVIMAHAHARRAAVMMALLYGAVIGSILSALLLLDHPYAGSVSVTTHHVEDVLSRFNNPPYSTPKASP